MGIGRREFLRLAGLASGGLVTNPLQAVVTANDFYINKKLGILFQKPTTWHFLNVQDFGTLKDDQILSDDWEDSKEEVWEALGDPICIVTKYLGDTPGSKGIFSPTATLNVLHETELLDSDVKSFDDIIELSNYGTSQILKNFKVLKTYKPYKICDCEVREFDTEYLFEHVDLVAPLKVELKAVKAHHHGYYYDFNFHQSTAQGQTAVKEFAAMIKSIRFL